MFKLFWLKRTFIFLFGILIFTLGVSIIILSDLGAGAWDTVFVGLYWHLGFTVGTWLFVVLMILMFINAFIVKKSPDWFAFITIFTSSFAVDFWLVIVLTQIEPGHLITRILFLSIGIILLALGIVIYIKSGFPRNPIDGLMLALHKRFKWSLQKSRTIGEICAVLIGFALQGPVGIGTLIIAIFVGPLIQRFDKIFNQR